MYVIAHDVYGILKMLAFFFKLICNQCDEIHLFLPVMVCQMHRLADEMLNYRAASNGMGIHYKTVEIPVVASEVMAF